MDSGLDESADVPVAHGGEAREVADGAGGRIGEADVHVSQRSWGWEVRHRKIAYFSAKKRTKRYEISAKT